MAREPTIVALVWTVAVLGLDAVVIAGAVHRSLALLASSVGRWIPIVSILSVTWAAGTMVVMKPWGQLDAGAGVR